MNPQDWLNHLMQSNDGLAKFVSLIADSGTAIVGISAPLLALFVALRSRSFARILTSHRIRMLRSAGIPSTPATKALVKRRVSECLNDELYSVYHEHTWLAHVVSSGSAPPQGLEFALSIEQRRELSRAYRHRAARIEGWRYPRADNFKLLKAHIEMFRDVADHIDQQLRLQMSNRVPAMHFETGADRWAAYVYPKPSMNLQGLEIMTSWTRFRYVTSTPTALQRAESEALDGAKLVLDAEASAKLEKGFERPHAYDGVLSALTAFRMESDSLSGRPRLRLGLSEMTYGVYSKTHRALDHPVADHEPHLLTYSMLPVTRDREIILVRRSNFVMYAGQYGAGVGGNLEVLPADIGQSDADRQGNPHPTLAIVREGLEELGLHIEPRQVVWTGLGEVTQSAEERSVRILCAHTCLNLSAEEIALSAQTQSTVDGRWEHQGEFLAICTRGSSPLDLMRWFVNAPDLMPHARLCGLFAISVLCRTDIPDISLLGGPAPEISVRTVLGPESSPAPALSGSPSHTAVKAVTKTPERSWRPLTAD